MDDRFDKSMVLEDGTPHPESCTICKAMRQRCSYCWEDNCKQLQLTVDALEEESCELEGAISRLVIDNRELHLSCERLRDQLFAMKKKEIQYVQHLKEVGVTVVDETLEDKAKKMTPEELAAEEATLDRIEEEIWGA